VLLRLYEREGIAFLRRLNGMFAIAIDDAREDAMYLVRDRIGVKPLYVADDGRQRAVRLRDQGAAAGAAKADRRRRSISRPSTTT
jgi:glutamine phosphoribosylpyrophosphate amidotransferase